MTALLLLFLLLVAPLSATTRYISPSGTNASPCTTSGSPCKTFAYVVPLLVAGDTLILKDGTYTTSTTGTVSINGLNGTAALPITIQAEHERLAYILGTGPVPFAIANSSYIVIHGLRVENIDAYYANPDGGNVMRLRSCTNMTVRRCLVQKNNRCYNGGVLAIETGSNILIEENEAYSFHRNGIGGNSISNTTFRRNYVNGRSYADIATGCGSGGTSAGYGPSNTTATGDSGIVIYPGSNNVVENNIVENVLYGMDEEAAGTTSGNSFYGNITNACISGIGFHARNGIGGQMPTNTVVRDFVAIGSTSIGIYLRSNKNTQITNATILGGTNIGGLAADEPSVDQGDGSPSFYATNVLSTSNSGYGFSSTNQTAWLINYPNSFGNSGAAFTPTVASAPSNITNSLTTDPSLSSCKVWIPASSPMKGAGLSGADIGANILYETVNGVLTSTKLWDTGTNDFVGCGAIVTGVNDVAGSSCSNVDIRLNINQGGCSFPSGYGTSSTAGGFWLPTETFSSYTIGADMDTGAGGTGWTGNWAAGTAAVTIAAAPSGSGGQGDNAAFVNADPNFSYTRVFSDLSAGLVSWLFRLDSTTLGDSILFALDETSTARGLITLDTGGIAKLYDATSGTRIQFGTWTANTWNKITVEFDDAAQPNAFRAKLNAGNFSQWQGCANGGSYSVINRFRMTTFNGSGFAGQLYVDDIKEGSAASLVSTIELVDIGLANQGFYVGTIKPLTWSSTDVTGNIDLLISRNSGLTYEPLALGISNTGTYNWTVTGPACTTCRVKVRASSNSNINDVSLPFRVFGRHLK